MSIFWGRKWATHIKGNLYQDQEIVNDDQIESYESVKKNLPLICVNDSLRNVS